MPDFTKYADPSTAMYPFAVGDVVKLNSGGISMTVSDIDDHGNVTCIWFQSHASTFGFGSGGQTLEQRRFPMAMLTNTSRIS